MLCGKEAFRMGKTPEVQTKKEYIRQLQWSLTWRLTPGEVQDVLSDYEGLFAGGALEGKSEADLCARFGPPAEAARSILREEGRQDGRLGLLVFVWTALAGLFNWWYTWRILVDQDTILFLYLLEVALIPLLYLLWRDVLTVRDAPGSGKWGFLFWGVPAAVWAAFYGWVLYLFFLWLPRWQALPETVQTAGSSMGNTIKAVYELAGVVILAVLLANLLWSWWEGSPKHLPAAAWCLGAHCSLSRTWRIFTSVNLDTSRSPVQNEVAVLLPLVLLVVGGGGAVLTALLIRRGGRHGRAA